MNYKLSKQGEIKYNAADTKGYERGTGYQGKRTARIYSVYRIENGIAFCESENAWGETFDEQFPITSLEPWEKNQ